MAAPTIDPKSRPIDRLEIVDLNRTFAVRAYQPLCYGERAKGPLGISFRILHNSSLFHRGGARVVWE